MKNRIASPAALEKVLDYVIANSSTTLLGNHIATALLNEKQAVSALTICNLFGMRQMKQW